MRRGEFKNWLLARGVGQKSATFRASAVRQVERAMAALGDPSTDIDEAFAADGFRRLRAGLDVLIEDRKRSGEKFRVLFPRAEKPDNMLRNRRAFLGQYGAFLRSLSQPERRSDWPALEDMRAEFLRRAPDFVDFSQRDGTYYEGERAYKDVIRERVMQITASDVDDAEAGKRIANALIPANGPLVQWQGLQTIQASGKEHEASLYRAVARCARDTGDASEALMTLIAALEALRDEASLNLTKGTVLNIALTVSAMAHPDFSAPFKISKARQLADALGERPMEYGPITREEIDAWLGLLRRIFAVMRDVWEWKPRDLFDVQGFVWMVLDEDWKNAAEDEEENDMEDAGEAPPVRRRHPLNIILYGPPGTGKTFATTHLAVQICDGDTVENLSPDALRPRYEELREAGRIGFVTFHQSFGYEDFVEGLRPEISATGAGFSLRARPGILRSMAERAAAAGDRAHVLVIDEINRANVSKVFGELITLLEDDKRIGAPNAVTLTLPYSGEQFCLPPNLHIVGTMNTADRSIALLDSALRRRFDFVETAPRPDLLVSVDGIDLPLLLTRINERIEYLFDRDHLIGHAYFMNVGTRAGLDDVMRRKVVPLLAEYFHEDWERILAVLGGPAQGFIERIELPAPPGLELEGELPRHRYRLREPFPEDAYTGLQA